MLHDTILTEPGLRFRSAGKQAVAKAMVEDKDHSREAWVASGFAVEFALKALIMRRRCMEVWPSGQAAQHLRIHTLKTLFSEAGVDLTTAPRPLKPSIRMVLDWERRHDYIEAIMPRKNARSMFEAAFGVHGVVKWVNSL